MATKRLQSGQRITLAAAAPDHSPQTHTLIRSISFEVAILGLTAGRHIARHQIIGELTLQCLHGEVSVQLDQETITLTDGMLLYLAGGVPHALLAARDSQLLLTMTRPSQPPR